MTSLSLRRLAAFSLLLQAFYDGCHAFVKQGQQKSRHLEIGLSSIEHEFEVNTFHCWGRRALLGSTMFLLQTPLVAIGNVETSSDVNLDALLDLPPVTAGCVRIFLCRHGQTENNRLRKVQGARVDPPINQNGAHQAINLGKSLRRLNPTPILFFSSYLQRAHLTAQMAAAEVHSTIKVQKMGSLSEVDFGPIAEGQPVVLVKARMQATYAAWASGTIDYRPQEGGDSGRDVLVRAIDSIVVLAAEASKSDRGCCVAVTHSTFLRILLSVVAGIPLFEAASMSIVNGGISVIDVPREIKTRRLGNKATIFGGLKTEDFGLEVPICHVIRINESRHLPSDPVVA